MRDVALALGADLARPGAVERLRPLRARLAAAELGEPAAHVDQVIERLGAVTDAAAGARVLKLIVTASMATAAELAGLRADVDRWLVAFRLCFA